MQLPNEFLYPHRTLIPRSECVENGTVYASCLDKRAEMSVKKTDDSVTVSVKSTLTALNGKTSEVPRTMSAEYTFKNDGVWFTLHFENSDSVKYILPVIGDFEIDTENPLTKQNIFYLGGGFIAEEYTMKPNQNGDIILKLSKINTNC